jgi:hypothetical protein
MWCRGGGFPRCVYITILQHAGFPPARVPRLLCLRAQRAGGSAKSAKEGFSRIAYQAFSTDCIACQYTVGRDAHDFVLTF